MEPLVNPTLENVKKFWEEGNKARNQADAILQRHSKGEALTAEDNAALDRALDDCERFYRMSQLTQQAVDREKDIAETIKYGIIDQANKSAQQVREALNKFEKDLYTLGKFRGREEIELSSAFKKTEKLSVNRGMHRKSDDFSVLPLTAGGFAVRPDEMINQIFSEMMNRVYIGALATHIRTNRQKINIPTFAGTFVPQYVAPGSSYPVRNVSDSDFGRITLAPDKHGLIWRVDDELFEDSDIDLMGLFIEKASEAMATQEEYHMLYGTGVNQPTGLLGTGYTFPADQIITTGTTDVILPEELRALPYRVTLNHRSQSCAWLMHRFMVSAVMKMRDGSGGAGTGSFIWQPSMVAGQPITIDGFPLFETENMKSPGTGGTSLDPGDAMVVFGDWSQYIIADRYLVTIEMTDQQEWEKDKISFKLKRKYDGAPGLRSSWAKIINA